VLASVSAMAQLPADNVKLIQHASGQVDATYTIGETVHTRIHASEPLRHVSAFLYRQRTLVHLWLSPVLPVSLHPLQLQGRHRTDLSLHFSPSVGTRSRTPLPRFGRPMAPASRANDLLGLTHATSVPTPLYPTTLSPTCRQPRRRSRRPMAPL
jgi:hypothetical protein